MLEGWQQHQTSLSQGNWPCEIIHFTFHEVCSGTDLLTLLDLQDHVREGYFSAVFLLLPDDSAGQQPKRTRSQSFGLDGLSPKATRIVRGMNQHTELTARFAKQALLCSVHKGATVLIIPGHPSTGPPSLWSMSELQTLEGLDGVHRGAGFSCHLGNAEQGLATGVLSNVSSVSLFLHREWSQQQQVHGEVSVLIYRGPLPETCPCTAQHNLTEVTAKGKSHLQSGHSLGSVFWRKCFDGFESAHSLRVGSKVWSATDSSLRPSSHFSPSLSSGTDSVHSLIDQWESRNLTRGALRNYTGDIEFGQFFISPAASAALSQGRSSLASRCTFSFWPSATSFSSSLPIVPFFPKSPRVVRTLQAEETGWRTSQLDCPKVGGTRQAEETGWKPSQLTCQRVGRTRQAEQPGSRCSHLHQVGEEFLNSEVASDDPALLSTRRICGAGGTRGGIQRTSSASFIRDRSRPPPTTITPGLRPERRWQ